MDFNGRCSGPPCWRSPARLAGSALASGSHGANQRAGQNQLIPLYDDANSVDWTEACSQANGSGGGSWIVANAAAEGGGPGSAAQPAWAGVIENCYRYGRASVVGYVWTATVRRASRASRARSTPGMLTTPGRSRGSSSTASPTTVPGPPRATRASTDARLLRSLPRGQQRRGRVQLRSESRLRLDARRGRRRKRGHRGDFRGVL